MQFFFKDVFPYFPQMLRGLMNNISISLIAMVLGSLLGLAAYLGKSSSNRGVHGFFTAYIEVMRNTPLLVQLYLLYFGLAQYEINISPYQSALIAMVINNGAYTAEILRAGFLSVNHGTVEAGQALGMSEFQVFRIVQLAPALKSAFPALINQFVMLFLFSSVASIIALPELTYVAMNTASLTARTVEVYLITGVLYYIACFIMINLLRFMEKKAFRW